MCYEISKLSHDQRCGIETVQTLWQLMVNPEVSLQLLKMEQDKLQKGSSIRTQFHSEKKIGKKAGFTRCLRAIVTPGKCFASFGKWRNKKQHHGCTDHFANSRPYPSCSANKPSGGVKRAVWRLKLLVCC